MDSLLSDFTKDTLDFIYQESQKPPNKEKIVHIINMLMECAFSKIQPFMYLIIGILIVLILLNFFQFYYYLKIVLSLQKKQNDIVCNLITE
jgi:uncharacterized membrane protein YukC